MDSAPSEPKFKRKAKAPASKPSRAKQSASRPNRAVLFTSIALLLLGGASLFLQPEHSQYYSADSQIILPGADPTGYGLSKEIQPGSDSNVQYRTVRIAPDPGVPHLFSVTATATNEDDATHAADAAAVAVVNAENQKLIIRQSAGLAKGQAQATIWKSTSDSRVVASGTDSGSIWLTVAYVLLGLGAAGVLSYVGWTLAAGRTVRKQARKAISPDDETIHTLVTVSNIASRKDHKFSSPSELVYSDGENSDEANFLTYDEGETGEKSVLDLPVRVNIDEILYDRLTEYKQYYPNQGCVLLVTEALPHSQVAHDTSPYRTLNGAVAAMSFARTVALARPFQTLLIDTGSLAWSMRSVSPNPSDIIDLPDEAGFYDVLAGREQLEDCLLFEDAVPGLSAVASGSIPLQWQNFMVSSSAESLVLKARTMADLIIVYAPRCTEQPEVIRKMSNWTNGIMLVTGVDTLAEAAEIQALAYLESAGAPVFGRIALDTMDGTFENAGIKSKNLIANSSGQKYIEQSRVSARS